MNTNVKNKVYTLPDKLAEFFGERMNFNLLVSDFSLDKIIPLKIQILTYRDMCVKYILYEQEKDLWRRILIQKRLLFET